MEQENHNGHYGAAVMITDYYRQMFFLQQKCMKYPVPEYRGGYSMFGGGIEPGETEADAVIRELHEELDPFAAATVMFSTQFFRRFDIRAKDSMYTIALFEARLPLHMVYKISDPKRFPVKEGRGALVKRKDMLDLPYIWGLEQAVECYMKIN